MRVYLLVGIQFAAFVQLALMKGENSREIPSTALKMKSLGRFAAASVLFAFAAFRANASSAIDPNYILSLSCVLSVNYLRTSANQEMFPKLSNPSMSVGLTEPESTLRSELCSNDEVAAKNAIARNLLFYKSTEASAIRQCGLAISAWLAAGSKALVKNPPAFESASPHSFYKDILSVSIAGAMFGKVNIASGTGTMVCSSFACNANADFALVCEIKDTNGSNFIQDGKTVWSNAEYEAVRNNLQRLKDEGSIIENGAFSSTATFSVILASLITLLV